MGHDELAPITIPELTLNQGRILAWHFTTGYKIRGHYCQFPELIRAMLEQHGFQAYDDATKLRDVFNPPMLLFESDKPFNNTHKLHDNLFIDPTPLFEAINKAERAHNANCRAAQDKVPLTDMRAVMAKLGVMAPHDAPASPAAAPALAVNSLVPQPDGSVMQVVEIDGELALRPLKVVGATKGETPATATPAGASPGGERLTPQQRAAITRRERQRSATAATDPAAPAGAGNQTGEPAETGKKHEVI